jgi:hypothetical protein
MTNIEARVHYEPKPLNLYFQDYLSYTGISERINGYQQIHNAIKDIPNVTSIEPVVLLSNLYYEYMENGESEQFNNIVNKLWERLDGDHNDLILRRLFPDEKGVTMDGKRSGLIASKEKLSQSIVLLYNDYNSRKYFEKNVLPELMVHRVVNVVNPPKKENPLLPFPGGNVTSMPNNVFKVQSTFGSDESTQGYETDMWTVRFNPDDSVEINPTKKAVKINSIVPSFDRFRQIQIPKRYQDIPSLSTVQVHLICEACRKISEANKNPYRIEFNGTLINNNEVLVITEAVPFKEYEDTPEQIEMFKEPIIKPVIVFNNKDFSKLPKNEVVYVHLSNIFFQGNDRRLELYSLSNIATRYNTTLVVFASGNNQTEHAVRVFTDAGHKVIFVENERFKNKEPIRVFARDSQLYWERENPIVCSTDLDGRGKERIGGKAFNLNRLRTLGFNVPNFFVIETSLFRRILDESGSYKLLKSITRNMPISKLNKILELIKPRFIEYAKKVIPFYIRFNLGELEGKTLSVRSSAICEDLKYSFAGVFESFLDVPKNRIERAILDVLISGISFKAISTALTHNIGFDQTHLAVIVQEMITARKGGIVYTKNPNTGNEGVIIIEATEGSGEKIAEGTSKTHETIEFNRLSIKDIKDFKNKVKRSKTIELTRSGIENVLTDSEIHELIIAALEIEEQLKEGPQDIEWAIDNKTGKLFILQARPL